MAKADDTWKVLPHRPLEKLTENLWRIEGDLPGMPLKRVMTVVRRTSGELVVHNPIALDEGTMAEIDGWGKVAYLIVPNGWHRLDAKVFKARYPAAKVLCPEGARKKVTEVLPVDGTYDDFPQDDAISFVHLDGIARMEGAMIVRSEDGVTVVLTDAVFNMPHLGGVQGFILKHVTGSSGGPRLSRVARLFMVKDKKALRAHLERLATADLRRVIVAHHQTIAGDAAGTLRAVAATL